MKITKDYIYKSTLGIYFFQDIELQIDQAVNLSKNFLILESENNKVKEELFYIANKYNVTILGNEQFIVQENVEFVKEYNELMSEEVELDLKTIPVSSFKNLNVPLKAVKNIAFMIDPEA